MSSNQPSLIFRNDTVLGVCQALGDDFGFHPNYLRVLFAGLFYFNPVAVLAVYFGLGALVAALRWFIPNTHCAADPAANPHAVMAGDNQDTEALQQAA